MAIGGGPVSGGPFGPSGVGLAPASTPITGSGAAIGAGETTVIVTGTFGASYQVSITPGWVTDYEVVGKLPTQFTVVFAVPAPAGGSTFDWVVSLNAVSAQAITGATQTVAAGSLSATYVTTASLPASYQVAISTSWVTGSMVTGKTVSGFTVHFAVPAPPEGGTMDVMIFGPAVGTVTLGDYLDELRDLLHDPNDRFWSAQQKANYINRARRQRDEDSAIQRSTISYTLTAGTDTYTFAQVGNGSIIDVLSINLIFGQTRKVLNNESLSRLNVFYRPSTTFSSWTSAWARQGPSTVIFGPAPSTGFVTEWDCVVYGTPLIVLADTDQVPHPYTKPVAFYAAYLAKINERKRDAASEFYADYLRLVGESTNSRGPMIPNTYSGIGMGRA